MLQQWGQKNHSWSIMASAKTSDIIKAIERFQWCLWLFGKYSEDSTK